MTVAVNFKNNIRVSIPQTDINSLGNDILVTKQGAEQLIISYLAQPGHLPSFELRVTGDGLNYDSNTRTLSVITEADPDYTTWNGNAKVVPSGVLYLALDHLWNETVEEINRNSHLYVASSTAGLPLSAIPGEEANVVVTLGNNQQRVNKYVFYSDGWHLYSGTVEIPFEIPEPNQPSQINGVNGVTVEEIEGTPGEYLVTIPQPFDRLYIDATVVNDSDNDLTSGDKVQTNIDYVTLDPSVTIGGEERKYGVQVAFDRDIENIIGMKFILICQN